MKLTDREKALRRSVDALNDEQLAELRALLGASAAEEPEAMVKRAPRWYRRKVCRPPKRRMKVKR